MNRRSTDTDRSKDREFLAPIEYKRKTDMKPKNTICLWFDKDAHEAAQFYAATFPDSKVAAVYKSPSDYPAAARRAMC